MHRALAASRHRWKHSQSQRTMRSVRSASRTMEPGLTSFECARAAAPEEEPKTPTRKAINTMKPKGKARGSIIQETQLIGSFRSACLRFSFRVFRVYSVCCCFWVQFGVGDICQCMRTCSDVEPTYCQEMPPKPSYSPLNLCHIFALPWPLKHHAYSFVLGNMSPEAQFEWLHQAGHFVAMSNLPKDVLEFC